MIKEYKHKDTPWFLFILDEFYPARCPSGIVRRPLKPTAKRQHSNDGPVPASSSNRRHPAFRRLIGLNGAVSAGTAIEPE